MSTFVLAFEYLDVNRPPHIGLNLYIISLIPAFQLHIMVMSECFMDIYKSENQEHFKKSRIISGLKWDR